MKMFKNKKDVDKLVENLLSKLSPKEFRIRALSIAQKYYEAGDYANCQKYVELYFTHRDNSAAAYKLLGQALQKMGQKEKALEQFKSSLDIDPAQTTTILEICELLADDEMVIDPGRAKYWCEKAEATFPRHPVTFRLRERLTAVSNPDPAALVTLLTSELAVRPKDALLHARLLKHYLDMNNVKEAFDHACNVEFGDKTFINNFAWYEILNELVKHNANNTKDWLYQLLLLTVRERICVLSISETPSNTVKGLIESNELLHAYDQAIENVARLGAAPGFGEFHNALLQHHRGQIALHAATFLLKKAKKDQLSWRDALKFAAPLMLVAWQGVPLDSKVNWLKTAPEKQVFAVNRWYSEGTYRCSQAGHFLLAIIQDKNQYFLDQVSQCYSGTHWRDKFYKKIFPSNGHADKMKTSYFGSGAFNQPILRIPRKKEVEAYDSDAQKEYANSLHHFIWMLLNYKNYAHFKCTLFDMLNFTATTCAPETLNKLDILAFLYCATLTAKQQKSKEATYIASDKPTILPANITELLCPLTQMKWWDCAYKFSQNELGPELTDIRMTLSRGIEVIRCKDNHGLDPELLCFLGRIFSEQAKSSNNVDEKSQLDERANLYYLSAIPLLEKLKSKIMEKILGKRLFCYTHKELGTKELNTLLEECKLYVAVNHLNKGEYEKVIEMISNLKSPEAHYHLALTYKKLALDEKNDENNSSRDSETTSKLAVLLSKAKSFAFKALDKLRENESNKNNALYSDTQELVEEIETNLNKIDPDIFALINDGDGKYSSDDNVSGVSEHLTIRTNSRVYRNISSTPKAPTNANSTNYRTALDSQILETTTRVDQLCLDKIENEIKNLQKRDSNITDFMEQTKCWFEENRKLGNQIISTMNSNMQNTTDQFKLLKISVDQVKDQIDECKNECKDVGEIKKQIAELRKEVNKLKKASSEQTIDDSDLYNLEDDYRTNDNASFANRLPFSPSQVIPPFNQRLVPPYPVTPNPYQQLYNQSLYNLYNQYSQFGQPSSVPGAQPMFDPTRTQVNYSGVVYPTPDQMYLDVAHLVPPSVPTVPPVPGASTLPTVPNMPPVSVPQPPPTSVAISKPSVDSKETSRSLPVNVVITSSDPLPTCTTTPAPVLSVTIPPKHIKGTPHNYQIPMPSTNDTSVTSPPVFAFPHTGKVSATSASVLSNWSQSSIFKTAPVSSTATMQSLLNPTFSVPKISADTLDTSRTVVDGLFGISSPNTSLNKSRTISEKSNTSVENYDPCPDFKPIVPLPAMVKVTTGEEDESVIFSSRAKLFRFVDKEWKERGIGEMKLLKHKTTGKVRVLMRREQVHKICANHIITADMEIKPMKNETKAYFWVANDFAEESVILEKFCIRFKTADIALDFYNAFENARQESMVTKVSSPIVSKPDNSTLAPATTIAPPKFGFGQMNTSSPVVATPPGKAVIGGFTFSTTPTFKTVSDDAGSEVKKTQEVPTSKVNVFSGLSFKSTTSSPFSNIFNTTPTTNFSSPSTAIDNASANKVTPNKLNTSDTVEEFEPNVDFKPVIPLPALIDQKTGEEDESILFEHRAKLLRFDAATKEWKERGLGNIKLLVHKDNIQKVRLLMRREQIMKVCCNHAVTKDMAFQKMPNVDKAVTWCAKDFSEGELVAETFCLRFKTAPLCDDFIKAVSSAQTKMKDESKTAKEEQNAAKQTNQTGFSDKFKPKPGSWQCDACYTNNLENFAKCACCETPRPGSNTSAKPIDNKPSGVTLTVGWGDKFKPKVGTWECQACLVRNEGNLESCSACNSPKDPTKVKSTVVKQPDNAPKFNFGIPAAATAKTSAGTSTVAVPTQSIGTGSELIKPQAVNWDTNKTSIFSTPGTGTTQFRFGIPPSTNTNDQKNSAETSIFDGTGAHKFSFGIPPTKDTAQTSTAVKTNNLFDTLKAAGDSEPVDFTIKKVEELSTPVKPALLPTPQTDSSTSLSTFGSTEGSKFGFVFKPKTPTKGKSPVKSPQKDGDDESDGNEYAAEDECHHSFTPVIPLPDKVKVVTGEEDEIELYGHVAKLYRFTLGEWKERGKGIVKILKHKDTEKLRVVMRRDQVLKICLNHSLTPDITYNQKDEKTWLFSANDFSEGELTLEHFCLRFKNKDIASEFKKAVDEALQNSSDGPDEKGEKVKPTNVEKDESDDVIFVSEILATKEERQKAKELMLPENFYAYKNKDPCQGCRGCNEDEDSKSILSATEVTTNNDSVSTAETKPTTPSTSATVIVKAPLIAATNASTPMKGTTPLFQSPTNSIYGTPTNLEKTVDTSIFRTPLGSIGSNSKTPLPAPAINSFGNNATNKENTFIQKPILFSGSKEENTTNESKPVSIFGSFDPSAGSKGFALAPPKLSNLNTSNENQNESATTTSNSFSFGSGQAKSIFGDAKVGGILPVSTSTNKSIFDFSKDNKNTEVKSIFGDENKTENLFTSVNQGSIFGPGALGNNQSKLGGIFGSTGSTGMSVFGSMSQNQGFDNGKSLFGAANQGIFGAAKTEVTKPDTTSTVATEEKPAEKKADKPETVFSIDENLSFAALSSNSGGGFNNEKKPDFKWEGAGQQLFVAGKGPGGEKPHDESGEATGAGADEEYDPHYEPIVPLPDKITVTTGEEDEKKIFGERCKLYRYDEKLREWKERGIGEMKVLYHPEKNTYRFLLRREQVHKAVLNMLLHMDLELLPMKNSDRAWTWAGRNFAENTAGEQETLAVRFKTVALATTFQEKVTECVKKLQVAAAGGVPEEKEASDVPPLRLPKHLEESARADNTMTVKVPETATASAPTAASVFAAAAASMFAAPTTNNQTQESDGTSITEVFKQVHFKESEGEVGNNEEHDEDEDDDDDDDEQDYDHEYDDYYNEEDEENAAYYTCDGEAIIREGNNETKCSTACIQVLFDQEFYSPKILITDSTTGEILADMLIYTDTEFQMSGDTCSWSGKDYTSNEPVDKTVSVNFYDSDTAMQFYDSCETSKGATYASTDPES
ncbi:nucleoporin 358 [Anticarsia gemmatalis]|uniref:nucleoporin 358 n=1 Tax=Anticarsia gemmatalis TaxID=129554 RepID=UPI003F7596A9